MWGTGNVRKYEIRATRRSHNERASAAKNQACCHDGVIGYLSSPESTIFAPFLKNHPKG
jgi:hypothetical protein